MIVDANQLRKQAEKLLAKRPSVVSENATYDEIYKQISELDLIKAELEIQTNNLHEIALECEQSKHKYVELSDFIPFGCLVLNEESFILEINAEGANLFGLPSALIVNRIFTRYIAPESHSIFNKYKVEALNTSNNQSFELKLMKRDGLFFYAQLDMTTMSNINGQKYLLVFIHDMSVQSNRISALQHSQSKMAVIDRSISMETLMTVIAHELSHPLTVMTNYLHSCICRIELGTFEVSDIFQALKHSAEQSQRAAEVLLRMKKFTFRGVLEYEQTNLDELIKEAILLVSSEMSDFPVKIVYQSSKNLPLFHLDKIHIQQVMINIVRNAIEVLRDNIIEDPRVTIEVNKPTQNSVEICIVDNGNGFSDEHACQLFNPYFTTKPYGIGLGLWISSSIIEAHGGKLFAENSMSGGACFKIVLTTDG